MKALTVKQPYAHLICSEIKDIENRSWYTNYRGSILIHAGKTIVRPKFEVPGQASTKEIEFASAVNFVEENSLTSAIIGSVEIVDCVENHHSIWAEKDCWHWVLENPKLFKNPIFNIKGKLSLWESQLNEMICTECGERCYLLEESFCYNRHDVYGTCKNNEFDTIWIR